MAEADVLLRVTGDPSDAESALDRLTGRLRAFSRRKDTAKADVDTAAASGKLQALSARLAALDATNITVDVDVRRGVGEQVAAIGGALERLGPQLGATTGRTGMLSRAMGGLTSATSAAGAGAGSAVRAGIGPLTAALNPATIAALGLAGVIGTSLVGALGAMVASAGMAAAAVGALAIGGFGALLAVIPLVAGAVMKFKEQADIAGTSANALKVSARAMGESFRAATSQGAANAMRGLADAIRALRPMVDGLRPAFTSLGTDLARAMRLAGNDVAALGPKISTLVTGAGPLFKNLGRAVGPFLEILLNIANAALPYLTAAMGRFVETLKGWAKGTSDAKKMDEAIGGLVEHMRAWGGLISSVGGLLGAFFTAIAPLGKGLVNDLAAAAEKTAAWVRSAQGTAKVREGFSALVTLARQVASGIASMVTGIAAFAVAAAPAVGGFLTLMKQVGAVLVASLGPPLKQVGVMFASIAEAIKPALPFFQNVVGPLLSGVFQGVMLALEPLIWVLGKVAKFLGWLGEKAKPLKPIFAGLGKVLGFIFAGPILGAAGKLLQGIGGAFGLLGKAVSAAGKVLSWIGGLVGKLLSGPLKALKAVGGAIGGVFTKLGGVAAKVWGGIRDAVGGAAGKAKDLAVKAFNALKDGAARVWKGIKDGVAKVFGGLKDFVVDKVSAAGRAIGRLASGFFNMGMDLIKGLIRGVGRMAKAVVDKAKEVVGGAIKGAKRLLGIGSPSKVFAGFGQAVGQGFIDGVEGMARPIGRAIEGTMGARVQAAGTELAAGLAAGGAVVGARGLRAPATAGGAPVTVERHYHIQTVTGQGAPDPDFLISQLDSRIRDEGV